MWLMWVLVVVVAAGTAAAMIWGGKEIVVPWGSESPRARSTADVLRRYIWWVTLALGAGVVSGLVMMGAAGRLAMRLLAVTGGDAAQGRITEADEIVGRITTDGTLGFVLFTGIIGGVVAGLLYLLIHRWLPRGRWRGLVYGSLLLVIFATRLDPLRPDNRDFDIVGPGWLAVVVFVAMGIGFGMLLAACAGLYSRVLPLLSPRPSVIALYLPLLILVPGFVALTVLIPGALVAVVMSRLGRFDERRVDLSGRVVLGVVALVAAPGFLTGVIDIAGRTP